MTACLLAAVLLLFCTCSFAAAEEMVMAITLDDLPSHGLLPPQMTRVGIAESVIRTLKDNGVPSVYGFINGGRLASEPASVPVLKLWIDAGFLLGNHGYAHRDLNTTDVEVFERDIDANEPLLETLMEGSDWHYFRYPFVRQGDTLEKRRAVRTYLSEHGYKIADVTLDFQDYAWNTPYVRCIAAGDAKAIEWLKASYLAAAREHVAVGRQMAHMLFGRDIKHVLLLHISPFSSIMLPALLAQLREQGAHFVSLPDAEADPAYRYDQDVVPDRGPLLDGLLQAAHMTYPPHAETPLQTIGSICQ